MEVNKKHCKVCRALIADNLVHWNNEPLCSLLCKEEFKEWTQEYDISLLLVK